MCAVSMIVEHYTGDKWPTQYPSLYPAINPHDSGWVTRDEMKALRKEVADLRDLLMKAKEYDKRTGQQDCEMEDKIALVRQVAKFVGVDLGDVLDAH